MRKAPRIGRWLGQLLVMALLAYGLNLGCILQTDGCVAKSACCANCNLPALDKLDHGVQLKLGPISLPTEILTLTAATIALGEVEPFHSEADTRPRKLFAQKTDPVRGPPLA